MFALLSQVHYSVLYIYAMLVPELLLRDTSTVLVLDKHCTRFDVCIMHQSINVLCTVCSKFSWKWLCGSFLSLYITEGHCVSQSDPVEVAWLLRFLPVPAFKTTHT